MSKSKKNETLMQVLNHNYVTFYDVMVFSMLASNEWNKMPHRIRDERRMIFAKKKAIESTEKDQ